MNDDTPVGVASAVKEGVTPFVVDMTVEMEKLSSLDDNTILGSFPPLSTPVTTMVGNAPSKSSYANVTDFNKDGLSAIATKLDVELKDNIVVAMPKITREGHIHVMYVLSVGEKKTVKKPSQTSRGVLVGPKMGFKPQKEYRHVTKTPNASSNGNKKKGMEPSIEVSNSNLFDVLNSVDNDGELGIMESDSEVELVFDETANLRILTSGKDGSDKGYVTNSLLEQ
nr:hypothetical protein [Tanacetum cinerariifolium]